MAHRQLTPGAAWTPADGSPRVRDYESSTASGAVGRWSGPKSLLNHHPSYGYGRRRPSQGRPTPAFHCM
eukprot:1793235-Pyramimonas_sp.AAC.1